MKTVRNLCLGVVLAAMTTVAAWADVLVEVNPFTGYSFGQQADAGSGDYSQSFTAPAAVMLTAIRWWGFHGEQSGGAQFDNFVVKLDGVAQTGSLSVDNTAAHFSQYTLTVAAPALLTASSISVMNASGDVEWYWQSAIAIGIDAPHASNVAFSLIGQPVPEPQTYALMLAGLAVLGLSRKRLARGRVRGC